MLQSQAERTVDPLTTIPVIVTPIHSERVSLETPPGTILTSAANLTAILPDSSDELDDYVDPFKVPRPSARMKRNIGTAAVSIGGSRTTT